MPKVSFLAQPSKNLLGQRHQFILNIPKGLSRPLCQEFEPCDAGHDHNDADYLGQIQHLLEQEDPKNGGAYDAEACPHGVGGA